MTFLAWLLAVLSASCPAGRSSDADMLPIISSDVVFGETDGLVVVEAEHFSQQELTDVRAFRITTAGVSPGVSPDGDPPHTDGASGDAYLEILPDTRRTHGDRLIRGTNFSPEPGKMCVLSYPVHFRNTGRYYVWVRAFSTGSEDNGLHVGIDDTWPESGRRLQWCEGKQSWRWESRQRTEQEHCGEPHKIYLDVKTPGLHTIRFSMREDGFEFDRWLMTRDRDFARPEGIGPDVVLHKGKLPDPFSLISSEAVPAQEPEATRSPVSTPQETQGPTGDSPESGTAKSPPGSPTLPLSPLPLQLPRQPDGDGGVTVSGELRQWHKITLSLNGPYAHEFDNEPNPFTDYELQVRFTHESGSPEYTVPGYFAADGNAAESSAQDGTVWRAHFSPDKTGEWKYQLTLFRGRTMVNSGEPATDPVTGFADIEGTFVVAPSDKSFPDLRARGRLQYTGSRYLQFAGTGEYFLKAGADAPETLLAYADFDGTVALKPKKCPLKTWSPHIRDWSPGDPTWQQNKGKGLIGAVNYLSMKGCNAFSFLTYNAGGDGDNVWPFVHRDDKLHYDCSKLDQWGIVFDHGTSRGMYLHFKLQETENDDHRRGPNGNVRLVPESLDGGNLGIQRRLYCRELIARFGHNPALNWNLGEENTQTTAQICDMVRFIRTVDPYGHHVVLHTYPNQQEQQYGPLLGQSDLLTGLSLQNSSIDDTHQQVVDWVRRSTESGHPWVIAFDESGSAAHGQCPDLGYRGFDGRDRTGKMTYTEHDVRRRTLWGTLMGGGAGVEYYFGYQYEENDLICEDWRSRDRSWDYCRIALEFFRDHHIPIEKSRPADEMVGTEIGDNSRYCLAVSDSLYLVYVAEPGDWKLDLSAAEGTFSLQWYNPREGGSLRTGSVNEVTGGQPVNVGVPPGDPENDWLLVVTGK